MVIVAPVVQESNPEVDPESFYDPEKPTDDDLETVPDYNQSETNPSLVSLFGYLFGFISTLFQ